MNSAPARQADLFALRPQGSVSAIAGASHHTRNGRDVRRVAKLAFGEASIGDAELGALASLKISFAGQSLDRLAKSVKATGNDNPLAV